MILKELSPMWEWKEEWDLSMNSWNEDLHSGSVYVYMWCESMNAAAKALGMYGHVCNCINQSEDVTEQCWSLEIFFSVSVSSVFIRFVSVWVWLCHNVSSPLSLPRNFPLSLSRSLSLFLSLTCSLSISLTFDLSLSHVCVCPLITSQYQMNIFLWSK